MTDTIVIGAGHNGLVCATLLARAGQRVTLVEAADTPGGMARTIDLEGGFRAPTAPLAYPLDPALRKALDLDRQGYRPGVAVETISLQPDGRHLVIRDGELEGDGIPAADQEAWPAFRDQADAFLDALAPLFGAAPPRLKDFDRTDRNLLIKLAWKIRFGLGKERMYEFLRLLGMNIHDVLEDGFEDDRLKGALAAEAVLGCQLGPRTPGTVMTWLQRTHARRYGPLSLAPVGEGNLVAALVAAAGEAGVTLRLGSPVARIDLGLDGVTGVTLADGETMTARRVVSSLDPRVTFGRLVGAPSLDARFAQRARQIRGEGVVAQLHLGLSGLPGFSGLDEALLGQRLLFAPDARYVERSFNGSKYGEAAEAPILELVIPSLHEPGLAPEGQHVMTVNVSAMPYALKGGWAGQNDVMTRRVIDQLEHLAPGLASQVVSATFLSPVDIEARTGALRGHWHHGELTLHQSFMMRPVHGAAQFETPVDGLYLCGAGTHPGGGLLGTSGRLAAERVLAGGGA